MLITTTDMMLPTMHVEDEDVDRETPTSGLGDRRWRSWTCPDCGCTSASYSLPLGLALCAGSVRRRREGKQLSAPASVEAKGVGSSSRPGRARLSRAELAEAAVRESAEEVFVGALNVDTVHLMAPDGNVVPAACAVCGKPSREAEAVRFGPTTLYHRSCLGLTLNAERRRQLPRARLSLVEPTAPAPAAGQALLLVRGHVPFLQVIDLRSGRRSARAFNGAGRPRTRRLRS